MGEQPRPGKDGTQRCPIVRVPVPISGMNWPEQSAETARWNRQRPSRWSHFAASGCAGQPGHTQSPYTFSFFPSMIPPFFPSFKLARPRNHGRRPVNINRHSDSQGAGKNYEISNHLANMCIRCLKIDGKTTPK